MTTPHLAALAALTGTYGGVGTKGFSLITVPSPNGPVRKIHNIREEFKFVNVVGLIGSPVNRGAVEDQNSVAVDYVQYAADNAVSELGSNLMTGKGVIHNEDGLFVFNSATTHPNVAASVQRQGSLPHGVTFNAQGFVTTQAGPPTIPPISTQPYAVGQPSQIHPQAPTLAADLAKFPTAILDDPAKLLRDAQVGQKITTTVVMQTDTDPTFMPGGGVTNSAFTEVNAKCLRQRSTFFIETISGWFGNQYQIQYTQEIFLLIDGVVYPHVVVASLPKDPFATPIFI